jgi:hypothetical protein
MLAYKDFAPKQISAAGLLKAAEYESLDDTVAAANAWIQSQNIDVIHVETVVLPNLGSSHSKGTSDPNCLAPNLGSLWNQFVRVWYRSAL